MKTSKTAKCFKNAFEASNAVVNGLAYFQPTKTTIGSDGLEMFFDGLEMSFGVIDSITVKYVNRDKTIVIANWHDDSNNYSRGLCESDFMFFGDE